MDPSGHNDSYDNLVLAVQNAHTDSCGAPPAIDVDPNDGIYRGYFENPFGEQWLVEIDREAKTGVLRGGDIGWERQVSISDDRIHDDLMLGRQEQTWLALCWLAATGEMLGIPEMPGLD
jgi:hypothetical protein